MKTSIVSCLFLVNLVKLSSQAAGHYRCQWFTGDIHQDQVTTVSPVRKEKCTADDSDRLTSYINECTGQNYVTLKACSDEGKWNCQSFVSLCKTLIRTESGPVVQRPFPGTHETQGASTGTTRTSENTNCAIPTGYFSMKDMGAAVLISFIAGATMLAIVIIVVWKCRNSQWESVQRKQADRRKTSHAQALHALTHIANAFGQTSMGNETAYSFVNPNYAQVIASNALRGDIENDTGEYEEIMLRKKSSSCKLADDCIYTKVNKTKRKTSISKIIQAFKRRESKVPQTNESENEANVKEDQVEVTLTRTEKSESEESTKAGSTKGDSGFMDELFDCSLAKQQMNGDRIEPVVDIQDKQRERKMSIKF